jgi:hypothetical protein
VAVERGARAGRDGDDDDDEAEAAAADDAVWGCDGPIMSALPTASSRFQLWLTRMDRA